MPTPRAKINATYLEECTDLNGVFAAPILFVVVERRSLVDDDRR
jgi:hypothetical protein